MKDKMGHFITLLHLQRDLRFRDYHELGLDNYEALVTEVDSKVAEVIRKDNEDRGKSNGRDAVLQMD